MQAYVINCGVQIIRSVNGMQAVAAYFNAKLNSIALVPTMGALHEGHLWLIREARKRVGRSGLVIVSVYVNPTQFGPKEDFKKYPRPFARDCQLCNKMGVNVVFAPTDRGMYPDGFSTFVEESQLSRRWEGERRPAHFRGVCTVVAKLLQIIQPYYAIFGQKDFQQAAVIKRMARDLNLCKRIVVQPTVREKDGLAMSSRNVYLTATQREQAVVLSQSLDLAQSLVRRGERRASVICSTMTQRIRGASESRIDYVGLANVKTLEPVKMVSRGQAVALLAVWFGKTRLIDNAIMS